MMRNVLLPPNFSHCTTVTAVLSLPLTPSIRVSNPGAPSMRIASGSVSRAGRERADILEIGQFRDLERQQPELLVDRNLLADHGRGEHLPHGVVSIDL